MKKLIFCCICIMAMMACGERNPLLGRWAMVVEDTDETMIRLSDDSLAYPELRFEYDTIYMDVRNSNGSLQSQCWGIYSIKDNEIKITDNYGKQQECIFTLTEDELVFMDKDEPKKVIMRLKHIRKE